ncbi:MAG: hypothetical protein ACK4OP_02030, partial [Gemmobacter sp.]
SPHARLSYERRAVSADDAEVSSIADDEELPAAFEQVKPASAHFEFECLPPDLALHIAHGAADDPAFARRLCRKDLLAPDLVVPRGEGVGIRRAGKTMVLHAGIVARQD